jgi:hypothetical protein
MKEMIEYRLTSLSDLLGVHRSNVFSGTADHLLVDINEPRDQIIEYLCWLFRSLKGGSWASTVTTLNMWQSKALGTDGRYLTANLEALRVGVGIRRLFSVSLDELGGKWLANLISTMAGRPEYYHMQQTWNKPVSTACTLNIT